MLVTLIGGSSEIEVFVKLDRPSSDSVAAIITRLRDEAVPGDIAAAVAARIFLARASALLTHTTLGTP